MIQATKDQEAMGRGLLWKSTWERNMHRCMSQGRPQYQHWLWPTPVLMTVDNSATVCTVWRIQTGVSISTWEEEMRLNSPPSGAVHLTLGWHHCRHSAKWHGVRMLCHTGLLGEFPTSLSWLQTVWSEILHSPGICVTYSVIMQSVWLTADVAFCTPPMECYRTSWCTCFCVSVQTSTLAMFLWIGCVFWCFYITIHSLTWFYIPVFDSIKITW